MVRAGSALLGWERGGVEEDWRRHLWRRGEDEAGVGVVVEQFAVEQLELLEPPVDGELSAVAALVPNLGLYPVVEVAQWDLL